MKRLTILVTALVCNLLLSGCGQSGPLYLPGNPSQMAVPPSRDRADEKTQEEEQEDSSESSGPD